MAAGKAPAALNVHAAAAAAACDSLNAVVAEFSETLAATPVPTIKRRLREAKIELPFTKGKIEVVPYTNGKALAVTEPEAKSK